MVDAEEVTDPASSPERSEPSHHAIASVIRALRKVPEGDDDAWLFVFSDLLDKARSRGTVSALQVVAAAAAASPADLRSRVDRELDTFEAEVASRDQLADWPRLVEPRVLLIVPKSAEYAAAEAVFEMDGATAGQFASHMRWEQVELRLGKPDKAALITAMCLETAGTLPCSHAIRDYVEVYGRPDLAILCGMAMGIVEDPDDPNARPAPGDVVVANIVFDTNPRRVTRDGEHSRFEPYRLEPAVFFDAAAHVRKLSGFAERLDTAVSKLDETRHPPAHLAKEWHSKVTVRALVSGDELVEDGSGADRASFHDRIEALEMEAAGFASTCHHLGAPWLVVRGIADYGTEDRDKDWQAYAAAAAMAFTRTFLEHEFEPGSSASQPTMS